jgi:CheY-like chemotaxis protein/phosphoribosyl 1,2-cyclic phosphodiesterase
VVTAGGARFILDSGTGARALGAALMSSGARPIAAAILLSHTHWDHIQGFPFFAPVFVPGNEIKVYAPLGGGGSLEKTLAGQMEHTYFPVALDQLPSKLSFHELDEGTHEIDGVRVIAQYLHHPAVALGYRIEADGASVLYSCDHEPFSETLWRGGAPPGKIESILHAGDQRHAQFMAGADLLIHDAQYTPEEYPSKKTWGHSTYEYAVEVAAAAGVRRLALMHHDPAHDDAFLANVEQLARQLAATRDPSLEVFCAFEGCDLTLASSRHGTGECAVAAAAAKSGGRILIADDDPDLRLLARKALAKHGYETRECSNGVEALASIRESRPDLLILDVLMPEMNGMEVLRVLRADERTALLPVLMLTSMADEATTREGFETGATDYLTKPFSIPQLAARVKVCLARATTTAQG